MVFPNLAADGAIKSVGGKLQARLEYKKPAHLFGCAG
jgi:hypothetical protein